MRKYYWYALKKVTHDSILHTRTAILGISQEQMAAKLHMSVRSYAYLESGASCCSALTLVLYLLYYCPDVPAFLLELREAFEKADEAA